MVLESLILQHDDLGFEPFLAILNKSWHIKEDGTFEDATTSVTTTRVKAGLRFLPSEETSCVWAGFRYCLQATSLGNDVGPMEVVVDNGVESPATDTEVAKLLQLLQDNYY